HSDPLPALGEGWRVAPGERCLREERALVRTDWLGWLGRLSWLRRLGAGVFGTRIVGGGAVGMPAPQDASAPAQGRAAATAQPEQQLRRDAERDLVRSLGVQVQPDRRVDALQRLRVVSLA